MAEIGGIKLDNPFVAAPLAGITDAPTRVINREYGAALVYSEMVSGKGLMYKNKKTEDLLKIYPEEKPVAFQIFGSEPEVMAHTANALKDRENAFVDINMGCPVPKIVNNGEGSALMKNPKLVEEIVSKVSRAIKKPVTIKIRRGFDDNHLNAVEIAKIAESAGAAAVAVHGRTREQYYSGSADWDCIRAVKEAVKIPVIGNGDITDAAAAKAMFEQTDCDGVMIGRGSQGNPWIFREVTEYLRTGEIPPRPSMEEVRKTVERHAALQLEIKGEYTGVREMRKHLAWYTTGYPNSAKFRQLVNCMETMDDLLKSLDLIFPV